MRKTWGIAIVLLVGFGIEGFQAWQIYKLKKEVSDVRWDAVVNGDDSNTITTDVGTIQFFKKGGYSIELQTAKYTADGLHLEGYVGNPYRLWISNLSLKFKAMKHWDRDEFEKSLIRSGGWTAWALPETVGEAQCTPIVTLGPGMRYAFEVTIPNVKQTQAGIRLVVSFAGGERYSYSSY